MKLAIVHDWIADMGGAERVLQAMTRLWPDAPVYTLFADRSTLTQHFPNTDVRTSWMGRVPSITRIYRYLAPLMPSAMELFDLSQYDTVLSSSVMFAKGVIVRPDTRHICYCYSPSRMLWDRSATYERKGILSRLIRHSLRTWDSEAARRPDEMVAISQTVASRITKYYRRDAIVIPPPVSIPTDYKPTSATPPYFLVVGRLVPHKNLDMVLEAFAKLRHSLVIAGDGPLRQALEAHGHPHIRFVGHVSDEELAKLYAGCQAVIIPNEEDFGLTAVEAMAHGKPVLALRRGGATETIVEGITGEFFDDPIAEALTDGIRRIHDARNTYDRLFIAAHAQQWSGDRWRQKMIPLIDADAHHGQL